MPTVPLIFPVIRGQPIGVDENNLVCLNDIWQASGFSQHQKPNDWRRLEITLRLISALLERDAGQARDWTKAELQSVIYAKPGAGGGTYADVRLALAYAAYLNPRLAIEGYEVFLRYKDADPTLATDLLQRANRNTNDWADGV
jgi:hypothetical protein